MTATLVLDAGALIALDRNDRDVWALLRVAVDDGSVVEVPAGVIGQAWRDGRRQAFLARALKHCSEVPLDGATARVAGALCGQTGSRDVIDASVALAGSGAARMGPCVIVTSDPQDLIRLVSALDPKPTVITV